MPRLFTALKVPAEFKATISRLPRQELAGRWQHVDDLHVTIRFLGEVDNDRIDEIISALDQVKYKAFGMEVAGMSCFYNNRQTVLYADVKNSRKLTHLCAEVTQRLEPFGFDFGTRPYQPHITLARLKQEKGLDNFIKKHSQKIKSSWSAAEFSLFQSGQADSKGRRFSEIGHFNFT